jgi:uncharacterized protein
MAALNLRYAISVMILAAGLATSRCAENPGAGERLPQISTNSPAAGNVLVTDEAEMLTEKQRTALSDLLLRHNQQGPGRIFLVTIKQLPPNTTIEKYAVAKINEKPFAPGERLDRILVLVALQDRKLRIETSKEVWPLLPDEFCKGVIDTVITPKFKEKRYDEGLTAGITSVITKLRGRTE